MKCGLIRPDPQWLLRPCPSVAVPYRLRFYCSRLPIQTQTWHSLKYRRPQVKHGWSLVHFQIEVLELAVSCEDDNPACWSFAPAAGLLRMRSGSPGRLGAQKVVLCCQLLRAPTSRAPVSKGQRTADPHGTPVSVREYLVSSGTK